MVDEVVQKPWKLSIHYLHPGSIIKNSIKIDVQESKYYPLKQICNIGLKLLTKCQISYKTCKTTLKSTKDWSFWLLQQNAMKKRVARGMEKIFSDAFPSSSFYWYVFFSVSFGNSFAIFQSKKWYKICLFFSAYGRWVDTSHKFSH